MMAIVIRNIKDDVTINTHSLALVLRSSFIKLYSKSTQRPVPIVVLITAG